MDATEVLPRPRIAMSCGRLKTPVRRQEEMNTSRLSMLSGGVAIACILDSCLLHWNANSSMKIVLVPVVASVAVT